MSVSHRVIVYPTTFSDQITVTLDGFESENVTFIIHSASGMEMYNRSYFAEKHSPLTISGLNEWVNGLYTMKVITTEGTFTRK